mmetsp:Transcript_15982/g.43988  ORF Transcript_15982/g.43988 Transcript_15982/m.43988 type:complete len:223 (-) Transcript_15982:1973-2641(-)
MRCGGLAMLPVLLQVRFDVLPCRCILLPFASHQLADSLRFGLCHAKLLDGLLEPMVHRRGPNKADLLLCRFRRLSIMLCIAVSRPAHRTSLDGCSVWLGQRLALFPLALCRAAGSISQERFDITASHLDLRPGTHLQLVCVLYPTQRAPPLTHSHSHSRPTSLVLSLSLSLSLPPSLSLSLCHGSRQGAQDRSVPQALPGQVPSPQAGKDRLPGSQAHGRPG